MHTLAAGVGFVWMFFAGAAGVAQATDSASPSLLHVRHAAVASDSQAASEAGTEILRAGGNAVDAACATALALGVVNPFASGLGGGGFALLHLARADKTVALDFRETAPSGLTQEKLGPAGIPPQSALSVGIPGEPRGLAEIVRRYGALPFSRCVEPALRLSRGFVVSPWLANQIHDEIERHPDSGAKVIAAIFSIDEKTALGLRAGDRASRPALTATLQRLRDQGADAFYRGPIAEALVRTVAEAGGVLSAADLRGYRPVDREPLHTTFLGHRLFTMPPPSAGGVILVEALGTLAAHVKEWNRTAGPMQPGYLHAVAEALKHGFADRARFLGDPAFSHVPLEHLVDPAYHASLRIDPDHVLAHEAYGSAPSVAPQPARDAGTAHLSVIDQKGNAVALTTTINLGFGARLVAAGVVLNDEMDDFAPAPHTPDVFALSSGEGNQPAPGKRPVSSMSPTIVLGSRGVEAVLGAAGGPRIVSATLQVLLDILVFGLSPGQALAIPRIHHQWEPDVLDYEDGLPQNVVQSLERKGQKPRLHPGIGKVNLIVRSSSGLGAASDPHTGGRPAGL
jgi:gamma-glutamyltranspeptidase/glutathione hydrolase